MKKKSLTDTQYDPRIVEINIHVESKKGFPGGSDGKESAYNMGDLGLIPGLGRSPGGGHGNPVQYSCLENPHGRGASVLSQC